MSNISSKDIVIIKNKMDVPTVVNKTSKLSHQDASISADNDIDAIKIWLNEFESKNTVTSYKQTTERFILWLYDKGLLLKNVTRDIVHEYEDFLKDPTPSHIWCGKSLPRNNENWRPFVKGLSNSSINLNLQILGSLFQYLIEAGYLALNPFRLKRIKRKPQLKIEKYLSSKDWQNVINYIDNEMPKGSLKSIREYERVRWIFSLLYLTGCRRHEVINAKMSDFFIKRDQWWFRVTGKGNKYGEIPVTEELLNCLSRYRLSVNLPKYPTKNDSNLSIIFSSFGTYEPITDSALYKIIKNISKKISNHLIDIDPASSVVIANMSTHWLRHTSATHQVDAGVDIRTVKKNLRHSLIETTMKYQHRDEIEQHNETASKFKMNK